MTLNNKAKTINYIEFYFLLTYYYLKPVLKEFLNSKFQKKKNWHENCLALNRKIILRRALNFKICIFIFSAL